MNANATLLILATLLSSPAVAAERVLMEVDCHERAMPKLQRFASDAGIDSIYLAQKQRSRAWSQAMRACHGGYDRVLVVTSSAPANRVLPDRDLRVVAR